MKPCDYAVPCPICGQAMRPKTRQLCDGWHDTATCCDRLWDICCQDEFWRLRPRMATRLLPRAARRRHTLPIEEAAT